MRRPYILLGLLAFAVLPVPVAGQQCGGVERWPVKVGSDAQAGQVDLANPVTTTIHNLALITRPQLPDNDLTRLNEETTVYVVQGRLVKSAYPCRSRRPKM